MPSTSRRQVLHGTALGVAAAAVSASTASASPVTQTTAASAAKTARSPLSRSRFASQLGATFSMKSPVATWTVQLDYVGDLAPALRAADEDRFRLRFTAREPGPPQGVFTFVRAGFEPTQLFVVPDGDRRSYVAIVNRL